MRSQISLVRLGQSGDKRRQRLRRRIQLEVPGMGPQNLTREA